MKSIKWFPLVLLGLLLFSGSARAQCLTQTANLKLQVPNIGNTTTWGQCINGDLAVLDTLLGGISTLAPGTVTPILAASTTNYVTANTAPEAITNFIGGFNGQTIRIICGPGDTFTSVLTNIAISLSAAWSCPGGSSLTLMDVSNVWTEIARTGGATGVQNTVAFPNQASVGTIFNRLAKLSGAPSVAIITSTTDTSGAVGIVTGGAGTTGNATIQVIGSTPCVFDGSTLAGDYVQISPTIAGACHDTGSGSPPASGEVIGRVLSTNGVSGTYNIFLFSPEIQGFIGPTLGGINNFTNTNNFSTAINANGGANVSGPVILSGPVTATAGQNIAMFYNVDGILLVDGNKYTTIASALAVCPATGALVISTILETWASDPFGSVTCPFDVWLIPGASGSRWTTNAPIRLGHNGQHLHSTGPNAGEIQVGGSFPINSSVISIGAPGPSGVNGTTLTDIAVDAGSITGVSGIVIDGAQELSGTYNTQVVNAMVDGFRVSSDQGGGAEQNPLPIEHVRAFCSASAPAACVPFHITSTAGFRVSVKDMTASWSNGTALTDCIKNDSTLSTPLLENIHVEGCTNGFHNTPLGGQFEVDGMFGFSNVTTVVRNDSVSASYKIRRIILNGSTHSVVDAAVGRPISSPAPSCDVAGAFTIFIQCMDALVPFQSAAPLEPTGTAPGLAGTGTCATFAASAGGAWGGSFQCTGSTGASTITITFAASARNGWDCNGAKDQTTIANVLNQTSNSITTCVLTATSITSGDTIIWHAFAF